MLTLVNILILFFTILVIYQIFLAYSGYSIIEGLTSDNTEYQPYNTNDPNNALILSQQNAGNPADEVTDVDFEEVNDKK